MKPEIAVKSEPGQGRGARYADNLEIELEDDATSERRRGQKPTGKKVELDVDECLKDETGGAYGRSTGPAAALASEHILLACSLSVHQIPESFLSKVLHISQS